MANIIRPMQLLPKNCSASTFDDHKDVAKRGGNIAREARLRLEEETGKSVISPLNAKDYLQIEGETKEQIKFFQINRNSL